MFKLIVACALVAAVLADVSHIQSPVVAILRQSSDIQPDGSYQWEFEADNGIAAQEQASLRETGPEEGEKNAQGSFSWTSPEGEKISISYVADANGYQPQGSHVPEIPAAIQRALEWNAAHPEEEEGGAKRKF